jgi:hypothetical protein
LTASKYGEEDTISRGTLSGSTPGIAMVDEIGDDTALLQRRGLVKLGELDGHRQTIVIEL